MESAETSCDGTENDDQHVKTGLSKIGTSADGTRLVFLCLNLQRKKISKLDFLAQYSHLQELYLAENLIEDLKIVGELRHLLKIDASNNLLTECLNFAPPYRLSEADLSCNRIRSIADLSSHSFLKKLILDNNQISQISGLENLHHLEYLSLKKNQISSISGLNQCPIRELFLDENKISALEGLEELNHLRVISIKKNAVCTLKGLENHPVLSVIDVEDNQVSEIDECQYLESLSCLRTLNLLGNPVRLIQNYQQFILYRLSFLTTLDSKPVTAEDKAGAGNFHGEDRDARRKIRAKYFATGELPFWPPTDLDDETPALVALGRLPHPTLAAASVTPAHQHSLSPDSSAHAAYETTLVRPGSRPAQVGDTRPIQLDYTAVDRFAMSATSVSASSISDLAQHLATFPLDTSSRYARDALRARGVFRWITENITLDCERMQKGYGASDINQDSAHEVLRRRRGLSQGYAELFVALATGVGLKAVMIEGWGKGPNYRIRDPLDRPNHVWNGVQIAGAWRLLDCCWAAGFVSWSGNTATFVARVEDHYFLTAPLPFAADHLPVDPQWQLADTFEPLTLPTFLARPVLRPPYFALQVSLVSHPSSAIIAATPLTPVVVSLTAPTTVALVAHMQPTSAHSASSPPPSLPRIASPNSSAPLDLTLVLRAGEKAEVHVVAPAAGSYDLSIFAKLSSRPEAHHCAVQYLVQVSQPFAGAGTASSPPPKHLNGALSLSAFPRQLAAFATNDVYLYCPLHGSLKCGSIYFFSLRVPNADMVAVVDPIGEWHNLTACLDTSAPSAAPATNYRTQSIPNTHSIVSTSTSAAQYLFEGRIKVNGLGTFIIHAKYPGSPSYTGLLQYLVT